MGKYLNDIVNYCNQNGFIFQGSEIYGGLANSWDYGPLGRELKENISGDILQKALDETIEEFPFFNCVLHRGLFWYYLEDSDLKAVVEEEKTPACMPLYYPGRKNLLYRVNYFKKRINLEMFHVLADGTGAFMFFRNLIIRYIQEVRERGAFPVIVTSLSRNTWFNNGEAF